MEQKLYWYEYKYRGFSPFCQPKGHIKVDNSKGKFGIIAYNRPLTEKELYDFELRPYNNQTKHKFYYEKELIKC